MRFQINDYYDGERGNRKLKKQFVFSYNYSPGLLGEMLLVDLFVKKDMNFVLHLFFHDKKIENELLKTPKNYRIEHYQESKLPYNVRVKLSKILKNDFILKESYLNDKNIFGILDRTHIGSEINHLNDNFSVDLSPDTIDKTKFKSKSEVEFLQLIEVVEKWLNNLVKSTINLYETE